uniref:Uncharacterized protein n=1 Tax=Rhizophora mucronata TaxID=61149 RepID=A0A2P2QY91_RHIMU
MSFFPRDLEMHSCKQLKTSTSCFKT